MKLAAILRSLLATSEPPELGPGPRPGVDGLAPLTEKLNRAFTGANAAEAKADLARALVLLWHDHFDAAHRIAQEVDTRDGSYVHAILHRREPDYDNARYWFRRVGQHSCYAELAKRSKEPLKTAGNEDLERTLIPGGDWDAFAFVNACESASRRPADSQARFIREIQRIEFEVLLEYLVRTPS